MLCSLKAEKHPSISKERSSKSLARQTNSDKMVDLGIKDIKFYEG